MTDLYKRTWFRAAALGVVAAALMVGCGKKEEPKTEAAAPAAAKAEPLKIAFAYVGPVGDGGWTFAHDNARKAIEKGADGLIAVAAGAGGHVDAEAEALRFAAGVRQHFDPFR